MEKTIRVLSVISLIVAVVCVVLLIGCICAQRQLLPLYVSSEDVLGRFYIPVAPIISVLDLLGCAVLLMLGIRIKGMVFEIVVPILRFLTPISVSLINVFQTVISGRNQGSVYLAGISAMSKICNIPLALGSLATVLMLLACGMSIAYKKMK